MFTAPDEEKPKKIHRTYTEGDLAKLDKLDRYNTLGYKNKDSTIENSKRFYFNTEKRKHIKKPFISNDLSKEFQGRNSPGPAYNITENVNQSQFKREPKFSFARQARQSLNSNTIQQYYLRNDQDYYPHLADDFRRQSPSNAFIGTEYRFPDSKPVKTQPTPGPTYDPPKKEKGPQYTFGLKHNIKGQNPNLLIGQTPPVVGPGSYIHKQPKVSKLQEPPEYSFTQAPRFTKKDPLAKYESYDVRSSFGKQYKSQAQTEPNFTMTRAKKDMKPMVFQRDMKDALSKVRIKIPQF